MIQYKRCIGGKKINILVDEKLFERERKIFDALFISYTVSYVETIEEQDENYFIYDKKYSRYDRRKPYYMCDTDGDNWIFKLMKSLESFYFNALKCTVIHGSCVRINEKNILLLGERWSGKTTFTYYLTVGRGGDYLDDDCTYLVNGMYIGFCTPLPMRNFVAEHSADYLIEKTIDTDGVMRFLYSPHNNIYFVNKIDIVVFPKYEVNSDNIIEKMTSGDAFRKIMKNIRSYDKMSTLFIDINRLTMDANCYSLRYSNSDAAYDLLCEMESSDERNS